ncbi:MAG: hypothetical protein Q7T20_06235 [Saprospiraceae bacterium]|nr:hypothetical protein [Saprospiraceae bacterium]
MKVKPFFLALLATLGLFFAGCKKELCCVQPQADYSSGIFVVNEGPWGGTGTISWYNPETGETQDSLFEKANNGAVLGQFVQSLTFYQDKAYIVVNGANRVVVVDAKTFTFLDTIGGLELPRFFLPIENNLAYVSQWGNDGLSGSLAKINLSTNIVESVVPVGHGPEKMCFSNTGVIYVANSGGFGTDSTVASVEPFNGVLIHKFVSGGLNPANVVVNANGLFALCKGNYDPTDPVGAWFGDLGPNTFGFPIPAGADDLVATSDGSEMYFIAENRVWSFKNNAIQKLFDQSAYGLAFDKEQNLLYCADPKGFVGAGEVVVYKPDGTKTGSFRTGIGPSEVVIVK